MNQIRYWTRWFRPSWHRQAAAAERLAQAYAKGAAAAEAAGGEYDRAGDPAARAIVEAYVADERVRAGMPASPAHEQVPGPDPEG